MSKKLINNFFLILVILFIILKGVLYYNQFLGREVYFYSDDAIYAMLSQRFLSGEASAFNPYWNAGFPLVMIPFYLITYSFEKAQVLVSMVSHLLLILVMYVTLKKISPILGMVAAFITAFSPALTRLVTYLGISEPFYILLLWLGIFFGWQAINSKRLKYFILTGLLFGGAYLTRTDAIYTLATFLVVAILVFTFKLRSVPKPFNLLTILGFLSSLIAYAGNILSRYRIVGWQPSARIYGLWVFSLGLAIFGTFFEFKKKLDPNQLKKYSLGILLLLLIFLAVNLPYILSISQSLGRITISGKYAYIGSAHPFTPEKDRLTTWAQDIWSIDYPNYNSPYYDSARILPLLWNGLDTGLEFLPKKIGTNLSFFAYDNLFTNLEAILTILGFLAAVLSRKYTWFALYLGIIWLGSLLSVSYFMDSADRYVAFFLPFFFTSQAFAVYLLAKSLGKIEPLFLILTIIIFVSTFFSKNVDVKSFYQIEKTGRNSDQKIIGDWLKSQNIKFFMGRTEGIAFYAQAKMIYIPAAPPEVIIQFAKAWGVEYIVSRPTESSWDYMRPIVDPNFTHPDLKLVHSFYENSLVWKVNLTEVEKQFNFRTQ